MMDFSFSDLFTYWGLIKQYLNPLNILMWGVIGGIIAFILVIILQVVLRKKILINRRHWSLKVLAYAYMAFFPIWVGINATQWFAIHGLERQIVKNMPVYLGKTNTVFNKYMKAEVEKIITQRHLELTGHKVIDKSVSYVSDKTKGFADIFLKSEITKESALATFALQALSKTGLMNKIVVDYIEKSIGKTLLMDKELTKDFMNTTFQKMIDDGVINTILIKHTKHLLGGFKSNILFTFLLIMAFPIAEILIAHWLEKKRLAVTPEQECSIEENEANMPELTNEPQTNGQ